MRYSCMNVGHAIRVLVHCIVIEPLKGSKVTRGKRSCWAYSVQSRSRSALVVRINDWKICLNRVPWFSTDSNATCAEINAERYYLKHLSKPMLLLGMVKIKTGFVSSLRSFKFVYSSPYIQTQVRLTILLNRNCPMFKIDLDGLHVVEEFGNLAE